MSMLKRRGGWLQDRWVGGVVAYSCGAALPGQVVVFPSGRRYLVGRMGLQGGEFRVVGAELHRL